MKIIHATTAVIGWLVVSVACGPLEDPAKAQFRARLSAPQRLSDSEMAQLMRETVNALAGKPVRVREGVETRTLDRQRRAEILAVLSGNFPVEDKGIRKDGAITLRGVSGPGTPRHAEVDAAQTLWIDINTMLPRRFELVYSMPGFGDAAYDLQINAN